MANVNAPFGLRPTKYMSGAMWTGGGNIYSIDVNNASAFYIGDPVASSGTADTNGIPGVVIGVAGSAIRGVVIAAGTGYAGSTGMGNNQPGGGPYMNPANLTQQYVPASKLSNYYVLVMDDPNVICEIQEASTGTAFTALEIGLNANFAIAAPATGVVWSGTYLDNSTEATTSTLNCRILRLAQRSTNAFGLSAVYEVMLNSHELRAGASGT